MIVSGDKIDQFHRTSKVIIKRYLTAPDSVKSRFIALNSSKFSGGGPQTPFGWGDPRSWHTQNNNPIAYPGTKL